MNFILLCLIKFYDTFGENLTNEYFSKIKVFVLSKKHSKDFKGNLKTRIQSGRHRIIVFLRFLDFIPISHNETLSTQLNIPSDWKEILNSQIKIPKF